MNMLSAHIKSAAGRSAVRPNLFSFPPSPVPNPQSPIPNFLLCLLLAVACWLGVPLLAEDSQWGEHFTRNMVSTERGLPESFDPKAGLNLKWSVPLGTQSYATPIVANGRVYIGTNNKVPRDPRLKGDRGVLLCLDEKDGHFLWQLVVPKITEDQYMDWPETGMSSPVTVEGDRVYFVCNRGEVLCLDAKGMANGNDGPFRDEGTHMVPKGAAPLEPGATDADILWIYDLVKDLPTEAGGGIWPHDGAHSSILIHGQHLYLNTGNGVDNTHKKIRKPDAPSLVVLDKETGRLVAYDHEQIGPRIFHCTWSSPALIQVDKHSQVVFAGGNGVVYGFEPVKNAAMESRSHGALGKNGLGQPSNPPALPSLNPLKKLWQLDFDPDAPTENVSRYLSNRVESPCNIYGMPVFHQGRLYVAGGGDPFWGKNAAWMKCYDTAKLGAPNTTGQAALRWSYPLGQHTFSTPAVYDGMVFAADTHHVVHCIDAETGQALWTHETKGEIWASPLVADGKVYVGTRSGDFWVLAASREKKILSSIELHSPISGTATAAHGVLYVATMTRLYALHTAPKKE